MELSPSVRFLRAGFRMVLVGMAMFAASVATGVAGGPKLLSGIFMVLMVVCAAVGSVFGLVARSKGRAEIEQIKAQAAARIRRDAH